MAEGLPTPKSREQLLSEMLTEYVGLTGINDLNVGSGMTQFFDVVARAVARTSGDIFQILRDYSVDRATGEALNRIGREERVPRNVAQVSSGRVRVTDTSFQKIATKIYSGASAPNIGSTTIRVSDASEFTATGRLYIGRGTSNVEGPLNYTAVAQVGAFWEITLASPTKKFHNISESVILGQGGTRNVPVNTVVLSPGTGATADVNYNVSSAAILLDGENVNANVQVVAQEPGTLGNAPAGAIREFAQEPFPNAAVINEVPFTTGADQESDDDYRDRIKKERLSRGLGTALAVKNAVLGAQASDENARVTSNEIDTTNPEQTILYIDNGEGYEEKSEGVGLEFVIDSAIGGERNFQLATGGRQTSVAKAFLESSEGTPFDLNDFDRLAVLVGGVISEHVFLEGAFKAQGAATAYEIVASINDNPDLTFEATTSDSGTRVVIQAKAEDDEFLQLTSPSSGVDAGAKMGFPSNEVQTVLLYKNRELLNKNGRSAFVLTKEQFDWSNSITNGDTLIISVDGTEQLTFVFEDEDFIEEGQHSIVAAQNNITAWANVINNKVTGVTAEVNGEQLKLTSNLGPSNRAGIAISPTSTLVLKGMFSADLGLTAIGNEADFEISRNTAQIKLNTPLTEGDSLNLGSEFTRAEIQSKEILGGQTTVSGTAYVWLSVDDKSVQPIKLGVTADTFINVSKPGSGIVRYESTSPSAFGNVLPGDYVIIWSEELSATNRLEGRVNAVTATTLDIKVTTAEESAAVAEGPILFSEGFTVIRADFAPQKIKIDAGVYDINSIASIMNSQLDNATVTIDNDEVFVIRTNTESSKGSVYLVDFNDPAKSLNLTKNSNSTSINSQVAFFETQFEDKQFPAFVHGKINSGESADPPNSYINTVDSSENLSTLGLDPAGWMCFAQPYGGANDVVSTECVEIEGYTGSVVNVEDSVFYRRSRVDDRYFVLNGYDFGHQDSIVAILDNDPTGKTFDMPLYRTAVTNITLPSNPNNFRAYDLEGGTNTEFTQFFGNDFSFDNYKALMQAKNVVDPQSATDEDAVLYRSVEWGRSGEKAGVGYFYPTTPDQELSHIITVGETVDINIFLKSGPSRTTTIDGTTEWNVTIVPFSASVDLVTYTYSGTGTAPGLASVLAGDYVSIINTGEFSQENLGAYRVESATASSFTVRRATGEAKAESNIASLEVNTVSFFETSDTTAQEIVDYVTSDISDYITAEVIADNGTTGAGIINRSTEEDSDFAYKYVYMLDGKNYILTTDLDAGAGIPQFSFKENLDLPTYSTNTVDAYSFNNGENIKLIPMTSLHVTELFNILAVTGYTTIGSVKSVDRNSNVQLATSILGTSGAVQVAGGTGSLAAAAIEGSASQIGDQSDAKSIATILTASVGGFHSDQWVKLSASEIQKKLTLINSLNSIRLTSSTPSVGSSKVQLFNRGTEQRFFGRNRYHTRTRGRTFKIENQGQFACLSWDENGTEPYFLKTGVELKDSSASTITIFKDEIRGFVDISVDSGDMRFDEVAIGDLVTLANRQNEVNNGTFIVIGRSADAKTIRILNPEAINELAVGSFTITDNTAVLGSSFTVGGSTLVEGTDFNAGATINDTASNLAAAISLLPNIDSTSNGALANISSQVPGVTIAISTTGGGATASGSALVAPTSNTGDISVVSEVQEGDSVTIGEGFNILNQGIHRVIRRFKNSIYYDNSNTVEEEVSLGANAIVIGSNASTNYDIEKLDGVNRIKWAGAGDEPALEDVRPGDLITLGTDFAAANQGEFSIVRSGEKLQEITRFNMSRGVDMTSGQSANIYSANDATAYYLWYNVSGGGGDPAPVGKTAIPVAVLNSDSASQVAVKTAFEFNNSFSSDFVAVVDGDDVVIMTVGYGPTTDASNVDIDGDFGVEVLQQGRRNFADYINVNGVSETGITISDVLEFDRESIKFKEYEGTVAGDTFVVSNDFLGESNAGTFIVEEVLSEDEIIVTGNMVSTETVLLDSNFNKVYIEEKSPYVGYKQISLIATNPANLNTKNVVFDTANQFQKIGEIGGVSILGVGKLELPAEVINGVDSYKFNTGLIGEANRIVYGDPRDNTTYPGVGAAGAEIFIKAPLVRRIEVSIDVRVKTGVPFSTIVEEVRNSVAALINSNPVGQPIPISNIVSNVGAIIGVQSVAISSPQYDSQNDVIRVNSGEKALVLDVIADVLVSKID